MEYRKNKRGFLLNEEVSKFSADLNGAIFYTFYKETYMKYFLIILFLVQFSVVAKNRDSTDELCADFPIESVYGEHDWFDCRDFITERKISNSVAKLCTDFPTSSFYGGYDRFDCWHFVYRKKNQQFCS